MAILVDYSAMYMSSVFSALESGYKDEDTFRHFFLNSLLSAKKKFNEYGKVVICADSANSWRKDHFPYYKATRSIAKQQSETDWKSIYEYMSNMYKDLQEHFKYKCIKIDRLEADDIIGIICHCYGRHLVDDGEKFVILSRDKDYKQLQIYANVSQYALTTKSFVVERNPSAFLHEQIMRGDGADGIPNMLSDDDTMIVQGKRQKTLSSKRFEFYSLEENRLADPDIERKYQRNKLLIDLSMIPREYHKPVLDKYDEEYSRQNSMKLLNYFIKKRLKLLSEHIQDFL